MLFETPIPTFPLDGGRGSLRCRALSPIQAVTHFKDFAPLVLLRKTIQCTTSSIAPGYTDTGMYKMAGSWQTL